MVPDKMNPLAWLRKHLDDEGGNDLVREMVKAFAEQLMSAEADALCVARREAVVPAAGDPDRLASGST